MGHQVIHFRARQAGAEVLAEILQPRGSAQNPMSSGAITLRQAAHRSAIEKWCGVGEIIGQTCQPPIIEVAAWQKRFTSGKGPEYIAGRDLLPERCP